MTKEITKTKLLDIAVVKTHTGQITIKPLVQVLEDFKVDDNLKIKQVDKSKMRTSTNKYKKNPIS